MLFANFKAAFDRLDRIELNRMMVKKGVDELRKRIMVIYKETEFCQNWRGQNENLLDREGDKAGMPTESSTL